MDDFYADMADMVSSILSPTSQGGLGQGTVILHRSVQGAENPERPWEPLEPIITSGPLKAAISGVPQSYVDGQTILASDLKVVCAVPTLDWRTGGEDKATLTVSIDGREYAVLRVKAIPAAGQAAALEMIVRG